MRPEIWDVQNRARIVFPPASQSIDTMPIYYRGMLMRFLETVNVIVGYSKQTTGGYSGHAGANNGKRV